MDKKLDLGQLSSININELGWNSFVDQLSNYGIKFIERVKSSMNYYISRYGIKDFLDDGILDSIMYTSRIPYSGHDFDHAKVAFINIWKRPITFDIPLSQLLLLLGYTDEAYSVAKSVIDLVKNINIRKKVYYQETLCSFSISDRGILLIPKQYNIPYKIKVLFDEDTEVYQLAAPYSWNDLYRTHVLECEICFGRTIPAIRQENVFDIDSKYDYGIRKKIKFEVAQKLLDYLNLNSIKLMFPIENHEFYEKIHERNTIQDKLASESQTQLFLIDVDPRLKDDVFGRSYSNCFREIPFFKKLAETARWNISNQIAQMLNTYCNSVNSSVWVEIYAFLETNKDLSDGNIFLLAVIQIRPISHDGLYEKIGIHQVNLDDVWDFDFCKYVYTKPSNLESFEHSTEIQFITEKMYVDKSKSVVKNFIDRVLTMFNLKKMEYAKRAMTNCEG